MPAAATRRRAPSSCTRAAAMPHPASGAFRPPARPPHATRRTARSAEFPASSQAAWRRRATRRYRTARGAAARHL
eukprot:6677836-Prymnesium_polylepis.1